MKSFEITTDDAPAAEFDRCARTLGVSKIDLGERILRDRVAPSIPLEHDMLFEMVRVETSSWQ